jgi:hypothetical protein
MPLSPPKRNIVEAMYAILEKNCNEVSYDQKFLTVRDLVGLWQMKEAPTVPDLEALETRIEHEKTK